MAYVTGTANSFADLVTAIQGACTANGWTLSGNVLHKGTCYAEIVHGTGPFPLSQPANSHISVRAGNGIDGANALTDTTPERAWLGLLMFPQGVWPDWAWPVTYHVMINTAPDEVLVFVNYDVNFWQWLGFGQSPASGNAGTGNWHAASLSRLVGNLAPAVNNCRLGSSGVIAQGPNGNVSYFTPLPFWIQARFAAVQYSYPNFGIHGAVDDSTGDPVWSDTTRNFWPGTTQYAPHTVTAAKSNDPLYEYGHSEWNSETLLLPVQIMQARPSEKVSLIGQMAHVRLCRNYFNQPGEVIALGPDRWKIFPAYRRNIDVTGNIGPGASQSGSDHSGTFALAVRYDGP